MDGQNSSDDKNDAASVSHRVCNGTLRVIVSGSARLQTITAYVTRHQEIWAAYARILWDLRPFDPSGITSTDILNIRHAFGEIMELRAGGRSAILVSKELNLVVKIAMALHPEQDSPVALRSFLNEADALAWLES
jgi:hypothetical protein